MHARTLALAAILLGGCASTPDVVASPTPDPAEALADDRPEVRVAALDSIDAARAAELLVPAAADSHPDVRLAAAGAASRLAGQLPAQEAASVAAALAGAFSIEGDLAVRAGQVRAIARLGGPVDPLLIAAAAEAPALRTEALYALGLHPPSLPAERAAAAAAAASHARDEDPSTRAAAAFLLAALGDPSTSEWLAALARDGEAQVRAFAARGLARVAENPSLLEALLGDPAVPVRVEAAHALAEAADGGAIFALAIERGASSLAHRLASGDRSVLQPLVILAPHVRTLSVRAKVTEALQTGEGVLPVRAVAAGPGSLELRTPAGIVLVALDPAAPAEAIARLQQAIASGELVGAALEQPEIGRRIDLPLQAEVTAAPPPLGQWDRGTLGVDPAGRWTLALSRMPGLDGIATPIGRVQQGMEVLERLRPGEEIVGAVLH